MKRFLINFGLFQAGWFACVAGGDFWALPVTILILVIHFGFVSKGRYEPVLVVVLGSIGVSSDTILMHLGLLRFPGNPLTIPLWLICLWLLFATCIQHSMQWTKRKPWLAATMGLVVAPVSYSGGIGFGVLAFTSPSYLSIIAIGTSWALLMPMFAYIARATDHFESKATCA